MEKIPQVPCPPTALLYRIVLSVPSVHTFSFTKAIEDGIRNRKNPNTVVMLRVTGTLFDQIGGQFIGRSCTPNGIKMMARSPDKSSYGLKDDGLFEVYFYALPSSNYNIVFDLYLERQVSQVQEKLL